MESELEGWGPAMYTRGWGSLRRRKRHMGGRGRLLRAGRAETVQSHVVLPVCLCPSGAACLHLTLSMGLLPSGFAYVLCLILLPPPFLYGCTMQE